MKLIQDILEEWSIRVSNGMPNPKNPLHVVKLKESMKYLNIPEMVIDRLVNNLGGNIITEITKRDLQTRIVSMGSGLGSHSNLARVKNDNDLSDSDFIKLIKKEFDVDKVDTIKPGSGENKSAKFPLFKWNVDGQDLSITLAGKVTGRGTAQTKDQEMSFLLVLSALQHGANPNNKEEFISTLLDSNVYGRVYDGGKISKKDALGLAAWLENNDDWYNSHIKQCQGFISKIGNKQAKKYVKDDSKLDVNIMARNLYKNEYNSNLDLDKWNPADVWLYYDTSVPKFNKLADLNNYLLDSLGGKGVIGISLKKGTGSVSIINGGKKKTYEIKKIDTKLGKFFSQNVYFEYFGENLTGLSLAFRIFQGSSEELIRGEGSAKGALAVQGKVKLAVIDSFKSGITTQVKKVLGGDTFDFDKKTKEFSLSRKGVTKYKLVQKAYRRLKSKMTMAKGGNKKEYDDAFKNDKTFIDMVNKWAKSSGVAENKVKALISSRFQTIVLGSIISNLSKKELEEVMIGMLKYGKSESDWSSAHFKLQ
jgi:hypothetical protein